MKRKTAKKQKMVACKGCGNVRPSAEGEYTCVDYGKVGFDCCVPGNHAICLECEDAQV